MANTMTLISAQTVGAGGTSGITFSSIPQTYTDLLVKIYFRTSRAAENDYIKMQFNSSATGYTGKNVYKSGTTTSSETNNSTTYAFMYGATGANATANTFGNTEVYIPNYTLSNNKSFLSDETMEMNGTASQQMALTNGVWANTSAITSIYLASHDATKVLLENSTAYLYGISKS